MNKLKKQLTEIAAFRQALDSKLAKSYNDSTLRECVINHRIFTEALFMKNTKVLNHLLKGGLNVKMNCFYFITLNRDKVWIKFLFFQDSGVNYVRVIDKEVEESEQEELQEHTINEYRDCSGTAYTDLTPLQLAVLYKNIRAIKTLLKFGLNPLIKTTKNREAVFLEKFWSLPTSIIEDIIKYAALQIELSGDTNLETFFAYFQEKRAYKIFAEQCIAEIKTIKSLNFGESSSNLFVFIVSQGEKLHSLLNDNKTSDNIFNILLDTTLPIYRPVIFRKFKRNYFLNGLSKCSHIQWYTARSKKVSLTFDCIKKIYRFLCKEDLGLLLLSLKGKS